MKFARRFAKVSPWAVAAVMALDLGHPIHAQTPKSAPPARTSARTMIVNGDAVINVQIAWLSDPALLHCNIIARETPEGIELVGFVPNEPVRQKALHIAKSICGEQIVNKLRIQAGMPIPLTRPAPPTELAPMASMILAETLGEKVMGLRITSPAAGKIEIAGSVPTSEDKLLISKTMKRLNGCVQVVNHVEAGGSPALAAVVNDVPMMATLPDTIIEQEPHKPAPAAVIPSAVKNPLKPIKVESAPNLARSEPKELTPPPVTAVVPPKVAPIVVVTTEPKANPAAPKSEPKLPPIQADAGPVMARSEPKELAPPPVIAVMPPKADSVGSKNEAKSPAIQVDARPAVTRSEAKEIVPPPVITVAPTQPSPNVVVATEPKETPAAPKSESTTPIVVTNEVPAPVVESQPIPGKATVKNTVPANIQPTTPSVEPVAPSAGKASVSDLPADLMMKSASPIVVPPPVMPTVVETAPMIKEEAAKPVVVPPPVVVKNETPSIKPETSKPVSAFNPLKIKRATKPVDVVKKAEPEAVKLPDVKQESAEPVAAVVMPKVIELHPTPPVAVAETPKVMELNPEMPKAVAAVSPQKLELIPETPKPVIEQPKATVLIPEPTPAKVEPAPTAVVLPDLPKPTVSVAPAPPMVPTANPKAGKASVSDFTTSPPEVKELPKPEVPVVVAPEVKMEKTDRYVPPAPATLPNKTMNYDAPPPAPLPNIKAEPAMVSTSVRDNTISGIIRQPGAASAALDSNTVRKAIEDICRGSADGVSVRETGGRQLTVGMKVHSQADWDRLYNKVKNLPEVAGYAVIYNVSIEPTAAKALASSEPMRGIIRTSATSAVAEGDTVKKAIEDLCAGKADDIIIKTTGKQQVTVALKVRSAADWDRLYRQIKSLPEVAGYAVIYNVSVK